MVRTREDRTYRVRQLPLYLQLPTAAAFLAQLDGRIGPASSIRVHSIANALSLEDVPKFKVVTLTFLNVPILFDNDQQEWTIEAHSLSEGKRHTLKISDNVIFDTHFLGFTPLNDVPSEDHVADCIAISGLASHPFGSWKKKDTPTVQSNFMWLRDELPKDEPNARCILYGYDTSLLMSQSFQSIDDLAITLINRLEAIGRHRPNAPPVIFLCHSLGGIILKRALVEMANNGPRQVSMLQSVIGVVAFGVPSKGMDIRHLRLMVEGQPNAKLIEALSPTSTYLSEWSHRFNGLAQISHIRLISVYETARTSVPVMQDGQWVKKDEYRELVELDSAILPGSDPSDVIAIDRDHSELVKFEQDCNDYQVVRQKLHDMLKIQQESADGDDRDMHAPIQMAVASHLNDTSSGEENDMAGLKNILDSLYVEEGDWRLREIDDPYQHTFNWVWVDQDLALYAWLQNGNDNCWIKGKPGSGKSTLMKYIHNKYSNYLQAQSTARGFPIATTSLIKISFFFHNRGSHMQKSFEGLLRSTIYQLITEEPKLVEVVRPIIQRRPRRSRVFKWTLIELQEALSAVLNQNICTINVTLFLDALDEYNGPPSAVIDIVQLILKAQRSPTSKTKIKLLFSSRPWNAFLDAFKDVPSFSIHEYTREDVDRFVRGKFGESPGAQELLLPYDPPETGEAHDLVDEIVAKSEGVFLWVKLVVDEFMNSAADGLTMSEARAMLAKFPRDLNILYQGIIERIPLEYRSEAHAMLEIAFRSFNRLSIEEFWCSVVCAPQKTLHDCLSVLDKSPPHHETIKRPIRSRCGGLLETVAPSKSSALLDGFTVQFMHQTAKEFVGTPGFTRLLLPDETELPTENGFSFIFKYDLARSVKTSRAFATSITPPLGMASMQQWQDSIIKYRNVGFQAEQTTSKSQRLLLDELEILLPAEIKYASQDGFEYSGVNNALSLAVISNLQLYVTEYFRGLDDESISRSVAAKPLLHCVVRTMRSKRHNYYRDENNDIPLEDMISLLIDNGEDINESCDGVVPFQYLFHDEYLVYEGRSFPTPTLLAAEMFLRKGQDPNVDIKTKGSRRGSGATICKPIHIADLPMARLLLRYKANVNALTDSGYTPLDICVRVEGNPFEIGDHRQPSRAVEEAMLLLNNGACLSSKGKLAGRLFVRILNERADIKVPQALKRMPVLSKKYGVWKGKRIDADRDPGVDAGTLQFQKNSSKESLDEMQEPMAGQLVAAGSVKTKDSKSSQHPKEKGGKREKISKFWKKAKSGLT